jgi:NADP-dependent 3-hydroxy acid dehydrogenase YdfG
MFGADNEMKGRVVVITGAGSGMGRELAIQFGERGSPVAITDVDRDGLATTAEMIEGEVLARELDVRDRSAVMAFAVEVDEWTDAPVGCLINNAGVTVIQSFSDASPEDDEWVMDVNYTGVVNGCHAFLPIMRRQGSGTIVNTSSVFGLIGYPHQTAYCASKHAVKGFTEALRHELRGTGVRVASVHPGGVKTAIISNARFHEDDAGNREQDEAVARFQSVALTTPERAATIIRTGIEKGRARIRVGPDAVLFDLLVRLFPVRYYGILDRVFLRFTRS